jgi:hypothetical protein
MKKILLSQIAITLMLACLAAVAKTHTELIVPGILLSEGQ